MEKKQSHFVVASSGIIHETIGADTLVINLHKGIYYNLSNIASDLWTLIVNGNSMETLCDLVTKRYGISAPQIDQDISSYISELSDQGLIKLEEKELASPPQSGCSNLFTSETYVKPVVKNYSDMESLLLADPLHEFIDE